MNKLYEFISEQYKITNRTDLKNRRAININNEIDQAYLRSTVKHDIVHNCIGYYENAVLKTGNWNCELYLNENYPACICIYNNTLAKGFIYDPINKVNVENIK
jgi:hypothetical protein